MLPSLLDLLASHNSKASIAGAAAASHTTTQYGQSHDMKESWRRARRLKMWEPIREKIERQKQKRQHILDSAEHLPGEEVRPHGNYMTNDMFQPQLHPKNSLNHGNYPSAYPLRKPALSRSVRRL